MIDSISKLVPALVPHWEKGKTPPIQIPALPHTLRYTIPGGTAAKSILVSRDQRVLRGQALTFSDNYRVPPIHASSSGIVTEVNSTYITLATDGLDENVPATPCENRLNADQLASIVHTAGLIGHGGAGFPLAAKLQALKKGCQLFMVNAAECDPLIYCDDALISQSASSIVESVGMIATHCNADRVCIGIENNKHDAIRALTESLDQHHITAQSIELIEVPPSYPSGAERSLLRYCSDRMYPTGKSLAQTGVLSMNIATCFALGSVLITGQPCTERITTVVDSEGSIHNFSVRLGTLIADLYEHLNSNVSLSSIDCITTGGAMMYRTISATDTVSQTSNCVRFESNAPQQPIIQPCIRCGVCATACPENLMPQHLHTHAISFDQRQLLQQDIDRCIECRCCDLVCPSRIPLAKQFQDAKHKIALNVQNETDAQRSKARYEKRIKRLASSEKKNRQGVKQAPGRPENTATSHKALIEAALARKKYKSRSEY